MAETALNADELAALRALDTPTVCNALEICLPERRSFGFTTRHLHCVRPELPPMVGYAKTVTIRALRPSADGPDIQRKKRVAYYNYVATSPGPTISVVQDLDDGQAGFGCFWGEVNSNVHKTLGCLGTITNGGVRDLSEFADGFQALAGSVTPSHANVHVVDVGGEVNVVGMIVKSGDLVHADMHGAVVIPHEVANDVPDAAALMMRREAVVLAAAKATGATVETITQAMMESAKVK
ncbi:MAG TPA: RraA family protein [Alphaproteobacteria bacterium]|nr:RraA family protein [Alphaproteobacteria bacterium]